MSPTCVEREGNSGLAMTGGSISREHEHAKTFLPIVGNVDQVIAAFEPSEKFGDIETYADFSGRPVSQRTFAECYLQALNRISCGAADLLDQGLSKDALRLVISQMLPADLPHAVQSLPDLHEKEWPQVQKDHETLIRSEVVRLAAAAPDDAQIQLRSAYMALMALEMAGQKYEMEALVANPQVQALYDCYRQTMAEARQLAGNDATQAGRHFVQLVQSKYNYTPALNVVSDYDGNLSVYLDKHEHSGGPLKPGEQTNQLINELDRVAGLTWHHRLPLTECAGSSPDLIRSAARMYNIAAQHSTMFTDVPEFCRQVTDLGGSHTVLSANHHAFVATQMQRSGLLHAFERIIGVCWDFHYADNKPRILMLKALQEGRMMLNLFTEDDNSGTAKHITSADERVRQLGEDWNVTDVYFMASRPADAIWPKYRVSAALKETNTPFVCDPYEPNKGTGKTGSIHFLRHAFGESLEA